MLSLELTGQSPFKTVYFHGLVRDGSGQKMSKTKGAVNQSVSSLYIPLYSLYPSLSLHVFLLNIRLRVRSALYSSLLPPVIILLLAAGNVIDPLDSIQQYGCDALRMALLTGTTPGQDISLSSEKLEANR